LGDIRINALKPRAPARAERSPMLTFYRTKTCDGCGQIQEALDEMVIAHKTEVLDSADELPRELQGEGGPPVLVDEGKVIQGREDILNHLEELEGFKKLWEKYQTDACYCGE
jgi:hypothetical protein